MYTVYMHVNKINGKKYVGQTIQDVNVRWGNGNKYKSSNKFNNAISKYGSSGHVSKCLRGIRKTHKGFSFKFAKQTI